jgi:hypothetical protein
MIRHPKRLLMLGFLTLGSALGYAQATPPLAVEKAATINSLADKFMDRLHQTLDIGTVADMFAPDFAARYRDHPGDFSPFSTPRMATELLLASNDTTLRRKLLADWNLVYLTAVWLKVHPAHPDPLKAMPPDFAKLAKKSANLQAVIGLSREATLASMEELNQYLGEADQAVAALRKSINADTLNAALHPASLEAPGSPETSWDVMGYNVVYTVKREAMLLVMADSGSELKLVTLAKAN